jgi:hypothetical protein
MKTKSNQTDEDVPQLLSTPVLFIITITLIIIAVLGVYYFIRFKNFSQFL